MLFTFLIISLIPFFYQKEFLKRTSENSLTSLASVNLETIRKSILTEHNKYRKRHQVNDLKRNSEIEKIAQTYTEKMDSTQDFNHSGNSYKGNSLGENIYWCSWTTTGEAITSSWYSEVSQYDFSNPRYIKGTGHFTQIVWKGSEQLGCGVSCNHGCYATCNYYPAGNVLSQFSYNVFPAIDDGSGDSGNQPTDDSGSQSSDNSQNKNTDKTNLNQNSGGMSTAGKVFLSIFIILLVATIAFGIFHFVYKKRKFGELKDYFKFKS